MKKHYYYQKEKKCRTLRDVGNVESWPNIRAEDAQIADGPGR